MRGERIAKLLFVINSPDFFLSHRLQLAVSAREQGYEVHVATGQGKATEEIKQLGFAQHNLPLTRSGLNPFAEFRCFWSLYRLFLSLRPDLVHLVTIKPILYGGLLAHLLRIKGLVVAVSGLGSVFTEKPGASQLVLRLVKFLYRLALRHESLTVIFQNPDDKEVLVSIGAVQEEKCVIIRGSGVNLNDYPVTPEPRDQFVVTMAARLLEEKGVYEFVEAAQILSRRGVDCSFWLAGERDPGNPSSIKAKDIESWHKSGLIELLGHRTDIPEVFANSNLVVLPSYREGLPKVLIEAAACGRAVVTTNVPGCRYAIEANVTGLLVLVRDADALANAIERLAYDKVLRSSMGAAGRRLAEQSFSISTVVKHHLEIYDHLMSQSA